MAVIDIHRRTERAGNDPAPNYEAQSPLKEGNEMKFKMWIGVVAAMLLLAALPAQPQDAFGVGAAAKGLLGRQVEQGPAQNRVRARLLIFGISIELFNGDHIPQNLDGELEVELSAFSDLAQLDKQGRVREDQTLKDPRTGNFIALPKDGPKRVRIPLRDLPLGRIDLDAIARMANGRDRVKSWFICWSATAHYVAPSGSMTLYSATFEGADPSKESVLIWTSVMRGKAQTGQAILAGGNPVDFTPADVQAKLRDLLNPPASKPVTQVETKEEPQTTATPQEQREGETVSPQAGSNARTEADPVSPSSPSYNLKVAESRKGKVILESYIDGLQVSISYGNAGVTSREGRTAQIERTLNKGASISATWHSQLRLVVAGKEYRAGELLDSIDQSAGKEVQRPITTSSTSTFQTWDISKPIVDKLDSQAPYLQMEAGLPCITDGLDERSSKYHLHVRERLQTAANRWGKRVRLMTLNQPVVMINLVPGGYRKVYTKVDEELIVALNPDRHNGSAGVRIWAKPVGSSAVRLTVEEYWLVAGVARCGNPNDKLYLGRSIYYYDLPRELFTKTVSRERIVEILESQPAVGPRYCPPQNRVTTITRYCPAPPAQGSPVIGRTQEQYRSLGQIETERDWLTVGVMWWWNGQTWQQVCQGGPPPIDGTIPPGGNTTPPNPRPDAGPDGGINPDPGPSGQGTGGSGNAGGNPISVPVTR